MKNQYLALFIALCLLSLSANLSGQTFDDSEDLADAVNLVWFLRFLLH